MVDDNGWNPDDSQDANTAASVEPDDTNEASLEPVETDDALVEPVETSAPEPVESDDALVEPVETSAPEPVESDDASVEPVETTAPEPTATAPRRRRAASRPAGPPAAVVAPFAVATDAHLTSTAAEQTTPPATSTAAEAAGESPAEDQTPPASSAEPRRRSRRATRGVMTVAFSSEEATEASSTETPRSELPAPALFQAPDLTAETSRPRRSRRTQPAQEPGEEQATAPTQESADTASDAEPESGAASTTEQGERPAAGGRRSRRATRAAGAPQHTDGESAEESTDVAPEPSDASAGEQTDESELDQDDQPRRRRRRGGRRRRRGQSEDGAESAESDSDGDEPQDADSDQADQPGEDEGSGTEQAEDADQAEAASDEEGGGSARRRRRRRRRAGVSEEMEDLSSDDPPNTVVKVREGRRAADEVTGVRGSTRIEAKKQRRRDGREAGRRRAPILTEAEFLARREAVNRVMAVRQHGDRTQIAVLEDGVLVEHYVNRVESSSMLGNVYLGRVQNVLPSMEAAFVDIGRGRNAVLYAGEVNWDAAGLEGQPKRIELALKSGDPVLVQVTKDPIGHKGARLTSQISLPGRFLVYVPEGSMTGISRKLPDTERTRLKGILKDLVPEGAGVIVRTAAEGASEEQLTSDVTRLASQWADIGKKSKSASAPALLYGEPDLAIKVVRDIFNEDFTSLLVQGSDTWDTLHEYIGWVAPDLIDRLQQWTGTEDLYTAKRIDEQLAKALDRKVWLPSGGSLVIDRTEAMTVVDVNTGKFTGQGGNLEETVTRNNLEAAEEIVRQLRLRDIGGIVVIDFIDMVLESNRDLVLRRLVECLGRDRTKHQVAEVTSLGLVQMTRKRIGQGLLEVFSTTCEACGGRGHVVHTEPVGTGAVEDAPTSGRGRGRRGQQQRGTQPVNLGGKQTGKTPPPPKFDENGHIDHSEDGAEESIDPESLVEPETLIEPVETNIANPEASVEPETLVEPVETNIADPEASVEPEKLVEPVETNAPDPVHEPEHDHHPTPEAVV